MDWFNYSNPQGVYDPENYSLIPMPDCPGNQNICAIKAESQILNGHVRPVISGALQAEISAALSSKVESANVLLRTN